MQAIPLVLDLFRLQEAAVFFLQDAAVHSHHGGFMV